MAYTPINWQTGDTITAEKMNKMDNGWSVTSSSTTLADQTVTTEYDEGDYVGYLNLDLGVKITAETIDVTFDNTKYTCEKQMGVYGDQTGSFTTYPFTITSEGEVYTASAGTYSVKVEVVESSIETSASFATAVANVLPFLHIVESETTWQEVYDTLANGAIAVYTYNDLAGCTISFATSAYEDDAFYVTMATVYQTQASVTISRLVALSANGALEPVL